MTDIAPNAPDTLRAVLDEVAQGVVEARTAAAAGAIVDLSGIDQIVDPLCRAIEALPPEQGRTFEPILAALIADLTELAAVLNKSRAVEMAKAAARYGAVNEGGNGDT